MAKQSSMAQHLKQPHLWWDQSKEWKAFGDRLNFLSPERQQFQDGKMRILPRREKRRGL